MSVRQNGHIFTVTIGFYCTVKKSSENVLRNPTNNSKRQFFIFFIFAVTIFFFLKKTNVSQHSSLHFHSSLKCVKTVQTKVSISDWNWIRSFHLRVVAKLQSSSWDSCFIACFENKNKKTTHQKYYNQAERNFVEKHARIVNIFIKWRCSFPIAECTCSNRMNHWTVYW